MTISAETISVNTHFVSHFLNWCVLFAFAIVDSIFLHGNSLREAV